MNAVLLRTVTLRGEKPLRAMASFAGSAYGQDTDAEKTSMLGRAQELAKGLNHPGPAFFHLLFKVGTPAGRPQQTSLFFADNARACVRAG